MGKNKKKKQRPRSLAAWGLRVPRFKLQVIPSYKHKSADEKHKNKDHEED